MHKAGPNKSRLSSPQQRQVYKEEKIKCTTQNDLDTGETGSDFNEEEESLACFMELPKEIKKILTRQLL